MKKPLHVLILEDNPDDAELIVRQLEREGFSVKWARVETKKAFEEGLEGNPDLILADYIVPSFMGIDALNMKMGRAPDIPLIIISGTIGEEIAVECMRLGATDYVLKDKLFRLGTVVKRALEETETYLFRRKAETVIQKQNEFLNSVIDSLNYPFYVIDVNDYTIKLANASARSDKISKNSTCYATYHKRSKPCDGTEHPCLIQKVKKIKKPVVLEHLHYDKDGNARNVEVHGYPIFGDEGNIVQMIEYCLDISDKKKAEQALQESEAKWRSITENSPDIIMLVGTDSSILFINRTVRGLTRKEVIGTCVYDYIPDKYKSRVKECHERVLKTGKADRYETGYQTIEGEMLHFEARVGAVRQSGKIVGITVSTRDITERKKAEEKLKEYQEHLEELVEERTSKLEKEILERRKAEGLIKEQNERLKELDRMKSEFLSTVAHELRTPLTSILGFSEILLKRKLDEERKNRFLKIINEESVGLSALINDLLDLSRIESGRGFRIKKAPTDIGGIILENVGLFQAQTDKHTFKVNLPDDLVKIEADKDKINQVIENLISNAVKFSPEGGEISVSIKEVKDEVRVTVSDNGIGIPEEDLPHVFEKFYRADNASRAAIGGTGLGLGIVKYIVESQTGEISAESRLGRGSTFSFTLPTKAGKIGGERRVS